MANTLNKVNSGGIEDGSIVNADIKSDAAIAGSKLADNAVGLAQMASGTDGQIITYDANGDPVAVGPGTDGQVLTSTGAGSPPAFEDAISEGTSIKSTGESGGTKFLREDGDGTSSWQAVSVPDADKIIEGNTKVECSDTGGGSDGTVVIETDGTEAFRVTNGQKVGIGETAPLGQLHVKSGDSGQSAAVAWGDDLVVEGSGDAGITILSGNAADASLIFGDDGDADVGRVVYNHSSNFLGFDASAGSRMKVKGDGDVEIVDGDLVIGTAGHGISFAATAGPQNATGSTGNSELFDDYEEGTWTPVFSGASNLGSYSHQLGYYIKTGRLCTAWYYVRVDRGTSTSNAKVFGLPFDADHESVIWPVRYAYGGTAVHNIWGECQNGGDWVRFFRQDGTLTDTTNYYWDFGYVNANSYVALSATLVYRTE